MKLKEVLLKALSFNEILKQFSIDQADFTIKDEDVILSDKRIGESDIVKERIQIEGKSSNGPIFNFFGTLHYNILNQLAVFEVDFVESKPQPAA
ncbi:hypothetical protein FW774_06200 [Pedobacter sp. BS3]|uniref:hypothetical protein n=1 Tax=Pedobacter sp. BS3 TaxID=2567937 RepID=UPI0011EDA7E5|nr:hypothetical protein [Pedobacter sp. BS3]TZF84576.1 hypothetical protein FW774_06200 [Pedobacter sp. BS3]